MQGGFAAHSIAQKAEDDAAHRPGDKPDGEDAQGRQQAGNRVAPRKERGANLR